MNSDLIESTLPNRASQECGSKNEGSLMKRVCAWCSKDMGIVPSENQSKRIITHGIYEECIDKIFAGLGTELGAFVDGLAAPVLVVEETGSVVTVNKQTRALLQKELPDIKHYMLGSRLPRESRVSGVAATRLTAVPRDNRVTASEPRNATRTRRGHGKDPK